jgi:hypothetical protein
MATAGLEPDPAAHRPIRTVASVVIIALAFASASCAQSPEGPESKPPDPPNPPSGAAAPAASAPAPGPQPGAGIASADELLIALERADRDIRTLSAKIQYDKVAGAIEGHDRQIRKGELHFADVRPRGEGPSSSDSGAGRSFYIRFDTLQVDNVERDEKQVYILHGDWFVEKNEQQKQMFLQRIAAPGERIDPLRLGEGPFPVPIGQRRDDILARFMVELLPGPDGIPLNEMNEEAHAKVAARFGAAYQLRLIPRPGSDEARDFREIRVWYKREGLIPMHARAVRTDGGMDELGLAKVEVNRTLPEGIFDLTPPEGWQVQERPFRRATEGKGP